MYRDEDFVDLKMHMKNSNCNLLTACVEVTHLPRVLIVRDEIFEKF